MKLLCQFAASPNWSDQFVSVSVKQLKKPIGWFLFGRTKINRQNPHTVPVQRNESNPNIDYTLRNTCTAADYQCYTEIAARANRTLQPEQKKNFSFNQKTSNAKNAKTQQYCLLSQQVLIVATEERNACVLIEVLPHSQFELRSILIVSICCTCLSHFKRHVNMTNCMHKMGTGLGKIMVFCWSNWGYYWHKLLLHSIYLFFVCLISNGNRHRNDIFGIYEIYHRQLIERNVRIFKESNEKQAKNFGTSAQKLEQNAIHTEYIATISNEKCNTKTRI